MASLHNVTFMINLMNNIRQSLIEKRFIAFRDQFLAIPRQGEQIMEWKSS